MLLGRTTDEVAGPVDIGRVRHVAVLGERSLLTVDGPQGVHAVVTSQLPDAGLARAAAAGLRRLQWVRLHLDGPTPSAELAGTTRHPQVRTIPIAAGLALAVQGLPAYVVGEGD